jgi:hypothetical protein
MPSINQRFVCLESFGEDNGFLPVVRQLMPEDTETTRNPATPKRKEAARW